MVNHQQNGISKMILLMEMAQVSGYQVPSG